MLFADPRRSAVDIVQAVGRALRPAPNKQFGYVIVPILHDADATAEDIFKSPAFKEILTTLRALAANDDRINEYFRGVAQGLQRKGGDSVQFDFDERLAKRIDLADFVREIELKCWDRLAKLSWRPFEEARAFARNLSLGSQSQWRAFCKGEMPESGLLPTNLVRKDASRPDAETAMDEVLRHFEVGNLDADGWARARSLPMSDFEDAVVAVVAEETASEFIVTRNTGDFTRSPVPAITPVEFLSQFAPY